MDALVQYSQDSFLSWATKVSRTRISTVNGFTFSRGYSPDGSLTLDAVLAAVQSIGLSRCPFEHLTSLEFVGEGGTFSVAKCRYQGKIVAVKYIKLEENADSSRPQSYGKRLQSVLQDVSIMHHEPLAKHPTILHLLGYGWQQAGGAPLPYLVVEYGGCGSLRAWLRTRPQKGSAWLRSKLVMVGDVAAGLTALHQCGIVHGDLKLDNIIVFDGHHDRPLGAIAKIADFGHSVLTYSENNTDTKYYGTSLYNAPEVFTQDVSPIKLSQMHKCDIWAYGLAVWEILADGEWYFKYSWRNDPAFARTSHEAADGASASLPVPSATLDSARIEVLVERGDSHVFGSFDVRHLQQLAKDFVNVACGVHSPFEKSFLRPFFDQTLQVDPLKRRSDLTKLPIMRHWNQSGTARLRSRLAMQLKSSRLSFDMFRLESAPIIPWSEQKGMLEDIERLASWQQGGIGSSAAALQTGLCYVLGFGAANDPMQAEFYLRRAAETSHPVARLFNRRIFAALTNSVPAGLEGYTELLSQFFQESRTRLPSRVEKVRLVHRVHATTVLETVYPTPLFVSDLLAKLPHLLQHHGYSDIHDVLLGINEMQVMLTFPQAVVSSGEASLCETLATQTTLSLFDASETSEDHPLIMACQLRRADIVCILLRNGADPSVRSTNDCTMLHWLFCIEDDLAEVGECLLPWREKLGDVIDLACSQIYTVHHQWPTRLHGTPLAFAAAAGSHASVELLLKLGASPTAKAFKGDTEALSDWTALHLAIKCHLYSMCHTMIEHLDGSLMLESAAEGLSTTFACALAYSSVVERHCIHGKDHAMALRQTVSIIPRPWLYSMSTDGRTPLMQAIDFGDVDVLHSLLTFDPGLAATRLLDPTSEGCYTYPILFACQMAARQNHPHTLRVPNIIASYDPNALRHVDSQGRTCLHMAATGDSEPLVDWLLIQGDMADRVDHGGRTALFAAENVNVFAALANSMDLSVHDHSKLSLVHYAVLNARLEILKELVRRQAPLDCVCPSKGTPLQCAVSMQSKTCISVLLDANCDAELSDQEGRTPMMLATEMGMSDVVREITSRRAHMRAKNIVRNESALNSLTKHENWDRFSADFKDHMDREDQALLLHYFASDSDYASCLALGRMKSSADRTNWMKINSLLQHPNRMDVSYLPFTLTKGQTPLHTAARFLNADAMTAFRRFTEPECCLDLMDEDGRSPFQVALRQLKKEGRSSSPRSSICVAMFAVGLELPGVSSTVRLTAGVRALSRIWEHDDWEQAMSRRDYGTLAAMMLLDRLTGKDGQLGFLKIALPETMHRIGDLFREAISENEIGFILACLQYCSPKHFSPLMFSWMTPIGLLKMYWYVNLLDLHMLRWRFRTEKEFSDIVVDNKDDYVTLGGEFRNCKYEWCTVGLGQFYTGCRRDGQFWSLRSSLKELETSGQAQAWLENSPIDIR